MKTYRRESVSTHIKPDEKIEKIGCNITVDGKVELRINNKVWHRLEITPAAAPSLEAMPTRKELILNQNVG